jgi:hypothetical protein
LKTKPPATTPAAGLSRRRRFEQLLLRRNAGRNPYGRAIVLMGLAYIGVRHLLDGEYFSILYWLDMPIHEAGHFIVSLTGVTFLAVAAGTGFQLAAPIAAAVNFVRNRDDFGVALCGAWLGTSLYFVAWYIADARVQAHPHFSPFGMEAEIHDWNYLLDTVGLLRYDTTIAAGVRVLATVLLWASIAAGAWLVWLLWRFKPPLNTDGH